MRNLCTVVGFSGGLFLLLGLAWTKDACSQEQRAASTLEEIIVTARKREESLQETPISVFSLSAQEIEQKRLFDLEALEAGTPGFHFEAITAIKVKPTIRGISSDETGTSGDASTAVFLDGVYQARQGMMDVGMFDLQRIDVLRGPQGTLWGKNVVGGAVHVVTNKPSDDFESRIRLTLGDYETRELMGMINVPISDQASSRLAMNYRANDGYVKNLFTGRDVNDMDQWRVRGHLRFDLSSDASLLLTADYTRDKASGQPHIVTKSDNPAADVAVGAYGDFETQGEFDGVLERDMWGVHMQLDWDLGFATFMNIFGYRDLDDLTFDEFDGTNAVIFPTVPQMRISLAEDASAWSNEARLEGTVGPGFLQGFDWTVGLYYGSQESVQPTFFDLNGLLLDWVSTNKTDSAAVFGEVALRLTDELTISGGARWNEDEKDYTNMLFVNGGLAFDTGLLTPSWDKVTWRVIADYRLSENAMAYGSFSTGWKSGAFSGLGQNLEQASTPLLPEELETFEVGVKLTWLDDRVRTNLAAFTSDYKNIQVVQFAAGGGRPGINLPGADVDGFELDASILPVEGLQLDIGYTYLHSKAESPENGMIVIRDLLRSPEHDIGATVTYDVSLASGAGLRLNLNGSYRSEMFDDPDNNEIERRPPRTLVNASVAWTDPDDRWSVTAWGKNLGDEAYPVTVSNFFNFSQVVHGPPRRFGVTVDWSFN